MPAMQDMELAHPGPYEPVAQIPGDVPIEDLPEEGEAAETAWSCATVANLGGDPCQCSLCGTTARRSFVHLE